MRAMYNKATAVLRRPLPAFVDEHAPVLVATGFDPLVKDDLELAASVYGLAGARRPQVALRKLHDQVWGNDLDELVTLARMFRQNRRPVTGKVFSNQEAARIAVLYGATVSPPRLPAWLGRGAPLPFDTAVSNVRRAMTTTMTRRKQAAELGWTGRFIFIVPAENVILRFPEELTRILPSEGAWVADTSYWRRRLEDADAVEILPTED